MRDDRRHGRRTPMPPRPMPAQAGPPDRTAATTSRPVPSPPDRAPRGGAHDRMARPDPMRPRRPRWRRPMRPADGMPRAARAAGPAGAAAGRPARPGGCGRPGQPRRLRPRTTAPAATARRRDEPRFDGFEAGRHGTADMTAEIRMPERDLRDRCRRGSGPAAAAERQRGRRWVARRRRGPPRWPAPRWAVRRWVVRADGRPARQRPVPGRPDPPHVPAAPVRQRVRPRPGGPALRRACSAAMPAAARCRSTRGDLDTLRFGLVPGGYFEAEVDAALKEVRDILFGALTPRRDTDEGPSPGGGGPSASSAGRPAVRSGQERRPLRRSTTSPITIDQQQRGQADQPDVLDPALVVAADHRQQRQRGRAPRRSARPCGARLVLVWRRYRLASCHCRSFPRDRISRLVWHASYAARCGSGAVGPGHRPLPHAAAATALPASRVGGRTAPVAFWRTPDCLFEGDVRCG